MFGAIVKELTVVHESTGEVAVTKDHVSFKVFLISII